MNRKLLYLIKMVSKNLLYGFILQCFFLTTLMASDLNAQIKPIDETFVKLSKMNWTVQEVLTDLESQTDYIFVYPDDLLASLPSLQLESKKQSVNDILVQIARTGKLKFKQVNNSIFVGKMSARAISQGITVNIDQIVVTGSVKDADGQPLPGATVSMAGGSKGTITNIDGNYSLEVPEGATLVFSYIGFTPSQVVVGSQSI